jgi:hypothetical protein
MLVQDIIRRVIESNEFRTIVADRNIVLDACYQLNVVMYKNNQQTFYRLYFDFGVPGESDKDVRAIVKVNSLTDYTIISLQ